MGMVAVEMGDSSSLLPRGLCPLAEWRRAGEPLTDVPLYHIGRRQPTVYAL